MTVTIELYIVKMKKCIRKHNIEAILRPKAVGLLSKTTSTKSRKCFLVLFPKFNHVFYNVSNFV